jgi:TPR repeat protein
MLKRLLAGLVIAAVTMDAALAGPWEDGNAAYQRGDYEAALGLLQPLAEQGDAHAQTAVGFMYANGQAAAQDDAAAVTWFRKAAEQGNANGQNDLGYMYANGKGVPTDYVQAAIWFNLAAAQGVEDAAQARDALAKAHAPRSDRRGAADGASMEAEPPIEPARAALPVALNECGT